MSVAPSHAIPAKRIRAHDGCLGIVRRRRTRQAAISFGERQTRFDPKVSEWDNPMEYPSMIDRMNKIVRQGDTRGSETSQYPEEEKTIVIA